MRPRSGGRPGAPGRRRRRRLLVLRARRLGPGPGHSPGHGRKHGRRLGPRLPPPSPLPLLLGLLLAAAGPGAARAKETAFVEVVLFESSPSGDYTTDTTGLTGRFSRAGATLSAEGEIVQMHPLGLCNNNDEEDLYEYGWVGVVKLEQPELDPKPCLTVLGKKPDSISRRTFSVSPSFILRVRRLAALKDDLQAACHWAASLLGAGSEHPHVHQVHQVSQAAQLPGLRRQPGIRHADLLVTRRRHSRCALCVCSQKGRHKSCLSSCPPPSGFYWITLAGPPLRGQRRASSADREER